MRVARRATRSRRLAAAVGSLALTGMLALAGVVGGGFEETEAAWNDTEVAQAQIAASWAESGWAKSTTSAYTNYDSFPERSSSVVLDTGATRNLFSTTAPLDQSYTDTGTTNFGPSWSIASGSEIQNSMRGCAQASTSLTPLTSASCTGGSYPNAGSLTRALSHGRSAVFANPSAATADAISWILASEVLTRAECNADGTSSATAPQAGATGSNSIRLRASGTLLGGYSSYDTLIAPKTNTTITGWVRPRRYLDGSQVDNYWRYSITSRQFTAPGWALSDLSVKVDIFRISTQAYMGTHESVLGRSECAVNVPGRNNVALTPTFTPRVVPAFPSSGLPAQTETPLANPVTGQMAASGDVMALRAGPTTTSLTSLPPATTVTSPLESATATVITTSAPPDPSAPGPTTSATSTTTVSSSVPTTATSGTPAPSIPSEPGTLSPTAQTTKVGSVVVNGTATDVVVQGDTAPSDADTAAGALDTWITDSRQPGGDWTTFTSTDPADGWRWAAINQKTGTVAYIR